MITFILVVLCVVLATALTFSMLMLVKLSKFIFELEDNIEESLDILDKRHKRIYDILQVPVAGDDPMIRSVISEIKAAREDLLLVANKLISFTLTRERDEERTDA